MSLRAELAAATVRKRDERVAQLRGRGLDELAHVAHVELGVLVDKLRGGASRTECVEAHVRPDRR